jgi:hypothetical protein
VFCCKLITNSEGEGAIYVVVIHYSHSRALVPHLYLPMKAIANFGESQLNTLMGIIMKKVSTLLLSIALALSPVAFAQQQSGGAAGGGAGGAAGGAAGAGAAAGAAATGVTVGVAAAAAAAVAVAAAVAANKSDTPPTTPPSSK